MNTEVSINKIAQYYLCPISNRRLSAAVCIHPCNCRVNEDVVAGIMNAAQRRFFKELTCPLCKKQINDIKIDTEFRTKVINFFKFIGHEAKFLDIVEAPPAQNDSIVKYPSMGPKGSFQLNSKDTTENKFCYSSRNSAIKYLTLNIELKTLFISFEDPQLIMFFASQGIHLSDFEKCYGVLETADPLKMKAIMNILITYNNFPELELKVILNNIDTFIREEVCNFPMLSFNKEL